MIVVCTGCSAKFKVADEKVGARGSKLRCSRCQTVFTVRREEAPAPAHRAHPGIASEPLAGPPPLPSTRRPVAAAPSADLGAPVDARSAFEIDLEPPPPRTAVEPDPFAPPLPDDPFAASFTPPPGEAPPPADPFGAGGPAEPDPFAAVQAPVPSDLLQATPAAASVPADDPFSASLPPLGGGQPGGDLALEERTTPPPRLLRPQSSAPLDDPFGGMADLGEAALDAGHPGDIPPMSSELPGDPFGAFGTGVHAASGPEAGEPAAAPPVRREAPLRVDPFAAAAVDADPLRVGEVRGHAGASGHDAAAAQPDDGADQPVESAGTSTLARLRSAAVNAVSLLALLLLALALLVVWRGNLPLAEAIHPSRLLAALTHQAGAPAPFVPRHVTSGLYERARGAPLLFVRGEVVSNAPAPVAGVRVAVELVKDGAVVARGEALAGGLLSPEELHGAPDALALARAAEAAAARAPGEVQPGQALPFLVALPEYPGDLAGVALRVRADGEPSR